MSSYEAKPILVTGATGYVGGRLVPQLLKKGYFVRAAGRSYRKLESRPWAKHPNVELFKTDVTDADSIRKACQGCESAYYLVHSMGAYQNDFAQLDRKAAKNMAIAAEAENLQRIIYLGGLGDDQDHLSKHLRSRQEVEKILGSGKVPVTSLKAAMIIGSGSASFEILRYLVERLPIMITPKWVQTPNQPIAIRNVIEYLVGCLEKPETLGKSFDIGGAEVLTYRKLMRIYAEEAGLKKRFVIPVPVLTPRLSSYWIHIVTPVPAAIAKPLAEGLSNPVYCHDDRIKKVIPQKLLNCREAIRLALDRMGQAQIASHWSDAGKIPQVEWTQKGDPLWAGGTLYVDRKQIKCHANYQSTWKLIEQIGGATGWYHANWLWSLRGWIDRIVGGVGLRRGRRHPKKILPGDALDFWRVLAVQAPYHLLLAAEMKLPGVATLEFEINKMDEQQTQITQTARFRPKGLWGIIYWYLVLPFHGIVFKGMLKEIARQAERP